MATPELAVLDGGKDSTPGPKVTRGSKAWAERIRKDTKKLAEVLDADYLKLARNLWEIFDTPIDGDPKNSSWVTKWGYGRIADYEEQELGLNKRQAERYRKTWRVISLNFKDTLDDALMDRLIKIGRSKVRELVRLGDSLTPINAENWLSKAEKLTFLGFADEVRTFLAGRVGIPKGDLGELEPYDDDGDVDEPAPDSVPPPLFGQSKKKMIKEAVANAVTPAAKPSSNEEEDEKLHYKTFAFYDAQWDTVNAAMERAQQMSGSKVDSNNMSLICLDFLATNDFKSDPNQLKRWLIRVEQTLGMKLVALSKDNEIVFGYKSLDKILKSEG